MKIYNPTNKKTILIFTGYLADQPGAIEAAKQMKNSFVSKLEDCRNYINFG